MAMITCSKCGRELSDKAVECPYCENPTVVEEKIVEETKCSGAITQEDVGSVTSTCEKTTMEASADKKTFPSPKALIASVGVVLFVTATAIAVLSMNSPIGRFKSAMKDEDFSASQTIYLQNADDTKFLQKAELVVARIVDEHRTSYANNETGYDDVSSLIGKLAWCKAADETINEAKKDISAIKTSREVFADAEKAEQAGEFSVALDGYAQVIEADAVNYDVAQSSLKRVAEAWCENAITEADVCLAEKTFLEAFEALNAVPEDYRSDKVNEKLSVVLSEFKVFVTGQAQALINDGSYREAYDAIAAVPSQVSDSAIEALKSTALNGLKAQVEEIANNGRYAEALALLEDDNGDAIDSSFSTLIDAYHKKQDEATMRSLKGNFTVKYDSMEKEYNIVPKGASTSSISIGYNRNIEPWIKHEDNEVTFALYLGFRQRNWIFMDKIIIDCDGKQFELNIDYWDRITDISGGTIAEAGAFMHVDSDLVEYNSRFIDAGQIANAMNSAKKVSVRFKGDGHKDVTIPRSHIDQVYAAWRAYELLEKNPDLISALT